MRRARPVAVLATLLALGTGGAAHATVADPSEGGLWYYTQSGMEQLHQRSTGEGVTIAVIDTAVNPSAPGLAGADITVHEPSYCALEAHGPAEPAAGDGPNTQHGTGITSVLVGDGTRPDGRQGVLGVAPGATIRNYAVRDVAEKDSCFIPAGTSGEQDSFRDAVADGADIINISGTLAIDPAEYAAAIRAGVIVVAAAGNAPGDIVIEPAALNGVVAVGSLTPALTPERLSSSGPGLGVVAPGAEFLCYDGDLVTEARCSGTSNAAAYTSGALALAWSAFPDATGNQILQALVRSTGGQAVHEPLHDDTWGYGIVSARLMLETDPTTYPDVNPFIRDAADATPPADELLGTGAQESAPPAADTDGTDSAPAPGEDADTGWIPPLLIAGALVGLLVVAGIVTAVLLAGRRRARTDTAGSQQQHPAAAPTYRGGQHG